VLGECGRSEQTFTMGPGAMVANKSGPVRAIRSYMGANSGGHTHREHLTPTSYYLDSGRPRRPAPSGSAPATGAAYGNSGPRVDGPLPNTDPKLGPANRFVGTPTIFYDSPGRVDGPRRQAEALRPLQTAVRDWP
jgi:hypothetical protein